MHQHLLSSSRSRTARASRWRRILNAIAIAVFGALFFYATAHAAHATRGSQPIAAVAAITSDVTGGLASPTPASPVMTCDAARPHRSAALSPSGSATCPLPDLLDERDDDDDDDGLHRVSGAARTHLTTRDAFDLRRSRAFEASVLSDGQTPNQFLLESVRRM